jgi:hypothetical protein
MKIYLTYIIVVLLTPRFCYGAPRHEPNEGQIEEKVEQETRSPRPASTIAPAPSISPAVQAVVQTTIQTIEAQPLGVPQLTVNGPTSLRGVVTATDAVNLLAGCTVTGNMNVSGNICLGTEPTKNCDAATKLYVDNAVAQPISIKNPCKAMASTNVTLNGEQTIDGVALVAGDRVLLTAQTNGIQNGIWLVEVGSWQRPSDFLSGSSAFLAYSFVQYGAQHINTGWICSNSSSQAIIDTNTLTFVEAISSATYSMTNVGNGTGQVYKEQSGAEFRLRTIKAGTNIGITNNTNDITIATTNSINIPENFTVNTDKFTINGTTGAGALKGNFAIQNNTGTPIFSVDNTTGNVCLLGCISSGQASCSASDARIKTNIKPLDPQRSLALINKLIPVSFLYTAEWRKQHRAQEKINFGLIAQDVQKILPELVGQANFSPEKQIFTVSYEQLIPLLINAVQRLSEEITLLRETVALH